MLRHTRHNDTDRRTDGYSNATLHQTERHQRTNDLLSLRKLFNSPPSATNKRYSQTINDQHNGRTQNNKFIYLIFTDIKII